MGIVPEGDYLTGSVAATLDRNASATALIKASERSTPILFNIPGTAVILAMIENVKDAMTKPEKEIPEELLK